LGAHPPGAHPSGAHPPGAARYRVAYRDAAGELVERETDDPTGLLHTLTAEAIARGERLEELSVGRPSLEDVYLELTADEESSGTSRPRDDDDPAAHLTTPGRHV